MDKKELPDLTDWLTIEVWTLEEAAMLWAAVDPFDHHDVRINKLGKEVSFSQRRKAMVYQRAAIEAVCVGTLPFVLAMERSFDDDFNQWMETIHPHALPDRSKIVAHGTILKSAAFINWAKSKKIQSYRQLVSKSGTSVVVEAPAPVPALPKPDFRDPSHPRAAIELITAIDIWEGISGHDYIDGVSPNPKRVAISAIELHPIGKELPLAAKDRISTLTNWKQKGGCNPTPGG